MDKNFEDLRKEYSWGALSKENSEDNPIAQFLKWYEEYTKFDIIDSTAMIISTVDQEGQPDSRVVLLKDIIENKFVFYTNYESKKGRDILNNPNVSLLFFWPEMERQIRIKGKAKKTSREISLSYFKKRPFESRIAAAVSPQSQTVPNREFLEEKFFNLLEKQGESEDVELPDFWGGVEVVPHEIEFWQGRISRLHDRIRYRLINNNWTKERLAP